MTSRHTLASIRRIGFSAALALFVLPSFVHAQGLDDFRSAASGNWGAAGTWQLFDGTNWVAALAPPTSSDGVITIQSGHTVTIATAVVVDQVVVNAGGQITLGSGVTLTLANGAGTDLTVNGILKNAGTVSIASGATIAYGAGGEYQHNFNGAGTIPAASWDLASTCEVVGYTSSTTPPASGLGQQFGNFTWNCPSQTAGVNLNDSLATVNGNFTVTSTGTGQLQLFNATGTLTIGGNFAQSSGTLSVVTAGSITGRINVSGDISLAGGTLTETGSGSANAQIAFAGSGIQTFTGAGTVSNRVEFTVNSGATLQIPGSNVLTGNNFTLASGAGLMIGSTAGITSAGNSSGSIQTASRSFSTGASYTYNGSAAQVTGSGLPATVNNLTISNAAGVSLTASAAVNGTLVLSAGNFAVGANTLTINGGTAVASGTLSSGATGLVSYNQPSNGQNVLAGNYGNLTFSNFTKTLPASGTIGIAGTFTPGSATGHTITGSTVVYNGTAAQTAGGFVYNNLTINNSAGVTATGSSTVNGTLALTSGAFAIGANTLTLNGPVSATSGSITSAAGGTVLYNQGADGQNVAAGNYGNLTFSGFTKTLAPSGTIGIAGTFTPGAAVGHTITGSTISFNGTAAQSVNGFGTFNNLTINNAAGVTLAASTVVNGSLTLTSGALGIGANTLTLNGAVSAGSGSITSAAAGTVLYNQGTNGQSVAAGNYGNLTFSDFNKTLAPTGTIGIAGTFTPGAATGHTITGSTVSFNGTAAQGVSGFATFNNLTISNAAGVSLAASSTVNGTLTLTSGALGIGANTLTLNGAVSAATGSITSDPTGTVLYNQGTNGQSVVAGAYGNLTFSNFTKTLASSGTIGITGTFTPGTATGHTTTGSTVSFNGAGAQTIPAFNYNNLASSNTGDRTLAPSGTIGIAGAFTPGGNAYAVAGSTLSFNGSAAQSVSGFATFNNLAINNAAGVTLAASSTVNGSLTLTSGALGIGANTLTLNGAVTAGSGSISSAAAGTVVYNQGANGQGVVAGSYGNLTFSDFTKTLAGAITIAGTFSPGAATGHTVTGSTVTFSGAGAQTIPAFNYNNVTSSGAGARTLDPSGTIGIAGAFTPGSNAYTVAGSTLNFNGSVSQTIPAFSCDNLTSSGSGSRTLAATGTIAVAGTFTPGGNVYTITGSTVSFNGAGTQTIPAFNYNNLASSNTGDRTLAASGTIGIAGAFTPGSNAYTVAGSTLNFNGSISQTIPAFSYGNLTSSGSGSRTLAATGTIAVAGTFTPGGNGYTVTGSTVSFNGAGTQTIPAFNYNNLASSNSGDRTLASSGTIAIAGAFTPGGSAYTVTGSTLSFNGSAAQSVSGFATFNNLAISNAAGVTLAASSTVNGSLTLTSGALGIGANTLTLNGAVTAGSGSITSAAAGTVLYNQGANGQGVAAGTYGNLTFSDFNKTLAGAITVAGTFSPGAATGHTVTGSTVTFSGAGAQTIPAFSYNNLASSGAGARTLAASGVIKIAGSFTPGSNPYTITGSTIEYNSASAQALPAGFTTYDNLTANNAAGVSLGATTTVGGTLALTAGSVTTGANTLELAAGGSVARTAGQVVGNLQKVIGTGASSATFEIGSATAYAPVNVSFSNVTTSGTLTASTTSGDHPSIGASAISSGRSVNRYWTLGNGGTVFDQCSVVLTFVAADVDAGASTGNFMVQNYNAPEWTTPTTGTRTATSIQATGLTTLGDFAAGEPLVSYYSQGNLAPNVLSSWNSSRTGGGTTPASFTSGAAFVIQSGHAMGTSTAWTVGTGGKIEIESGGTLTANHIVTVPAFQVDGGGTYVHAASGANNGAATDIPGSTMRSFAATSTVQILKWAGGGSNPVALPGVAWGNLTFNVASLGGTWDQVGALTTVNGNLTMLATGGQSLGLTGATTTLAVGGNYTQSGGSLQFAHNGGSILTMNVAGNFSLGGGTFSMAEANNVTGTLNLSGDCSIAGGTLTATGNGVNTTVVFNKAGTQSFTSGGTVSGPINFTVNSGATLSMGTSTLTGGGTFTLASGAGLMIGSSAGITSTGATGNIQNTGTRTYATGANYTYNGSAAQVAGAGLPATVNNLAINNAAGVTLGASTAVNGSLTLTSGALGIGANTLTLNGAVSAAGGSITSAATGAVLYNQGADGQGVAPGSYGNLTFSNFNKTLPAGTVSIAGAFAPGSATGHTITGSTINFNGAGAQTIPAFSYYNLTSSGSGARTLATSGTIGIAGAFTSGTNGYTVTNSTIEYNGASAQALPAGLTAYNNLTVNNPAGVSMNAGTTVNGTLGLLSGNVITGSSTLTIASAGTVSRTSGHVVGKLAKFFATGAPSRTFEIGSIAGYTPVTLSFASVTTGGTLTASSTDGDHPSLGTSNLSVPLGVNRYYTLGNSGIAFTSASAVFNWLAGDVDAGANTGAFKVQKFSGGAWSTVSVGTRTATSIQATGITSFSDWAIAEAANTAPALAAIGGKTINEGSTLAFTANATDAESPPQTLTFSLDAGAPAGASIDAGTGAFSWTPTEAQGPGSYPVTVRVTDNGTPALSAFETITLTVNEVNTAPVLAAIADKSVDEGSQLSFTATATDADLPANTLSFSLGAGAPAGATIGASTGVFSWTPAEAQGPGDYSVTVRVTDSGAPAMSDSRTFSIHVAEVNAAPALAAIADQSAIPGEQLSVTAAATDADVPANSLTFSLDAGAPAGAQIHAGTGVFTWTPTQAQSLADYSVTVRVTDNGTPALSASRTFAIHVFQVNTAPVLAPIADQSVAEGSLLQLTASATDADVPANVLSFSLDAGAPGGAAIDATTGVFSWTPSEAQGPGDFSVTVRVTDSGTPALSASRTFAIHVAEANVAPLLAAIADQTANEGTLFQLAISATDADLPANTLSYSLDAGAPAGAAIDATTGVFTWTPTEAQGPADYSVTVRVTDDGTPALDASRTFAIHVAEVNVAPVLAAIADQSVNEGAILQFTASATDADVPANSLSFSLDSGAPAGAAIDAATGVFSWTPTEAQGPADYSVTVRVTDNGTPALDASRTLAIHVGEVNTAPVLAPIANQSVNEGALLQLTASATDADLPANALSFSLDAGASAGAAIDATTGVFSWTPAEAQGPGDYSVTVRVTDNGTPALSASRTFAIHVAEVNLAPVLAPIADQTANEGTLFQLAVSTADADLPANTLSFSLDAGAPAGAAIDATTGVFRWTPTEAQGPADYSVTVRVTDDGTPALDASRTFAIHVAEVNTAPELAPIGNQSVDEGALLQLSTSATDADLPANALSFSLDSGAPAGATIDATTGVFSFTPAEAQGPGDYSVTVRVTDNGTPARDASRTFAIHVGEVNTAPQLAAIADRSVNEGSLLQFTASATDADLPANTLSFSLDAGAPAGAAIDATTGVFSWTPAEAQGPADYSVTVRVTDSGTPTLGASRTFAIHVNEVNVAPALAPIADRSVSEGSLLQFAAAATDADLPANTLTYSLDAGAPAGTAIGATTGVFSWTPTGAQGPADYSITVRVTDDGTPALDASRTFAIHVVEVNTAPALAPIADQSVDEGSLLRFTASATDADVPANTLRFSLDSGAPSGAAIDPGTGVFTWMPAEAQGPASYSVTVRVTDDGTPALSVSRTFTIHVAEVNSAPVLAVIADQSVNEGSLLQLTASATDADLPANALTYSLDSGAPAGAAIDATTGVFSWTPSEAQGPADYTVTVRVSDNGAPALDASRTFAIHVAEVNSAPELAPIADQSVNEGSLLQLTASATDADLPANSLSYSLGAGAPAGAAIDAATGVFSWTPTEAQGPADYSVTVRVTDSGTPALDASRTFTIHVAEVNTAPQLAPIADQSVNEGSLLQLTASATDADLPANVLSFSLDSGAPAGAAIDATTGVFSWTPAEAQGPADYSVTVRVTDGGTPALGASRTFAIHVAEVNTAPALAPIGNQTADEGTLLQLTAVATDADLPANTLSYSLDAGAPAGAAIDAATGVFRWTPGEAQGPGDYTVTVRVADNGTPALDASRTFSIRVNDANSAPELAPIADQSVNEGSLLQFTAAAADHDIPENRLWFSLDAGAPAGAAIDALTGAFAWTPSEAQGPADYSVTVRVTDDGTPVLSASRTFAIHVAEVNTAPVLAATGNQSVNEGALLQLTASASDADQPPNSLRFSLDAGAPAGAAIDPATGVFGWTPSEAQGPADYSVTVRVTDDGTPALDASRTLAIHVGEVNEAPVLAPIADQSVNENALIQFTASATDADLPANTLTFSLLPGAPVGAALDASTGMFSWTPTEAQGPGDYSVTVRVTDDGTPALTASSSFTIHVAEVNTAPVLAAIGDRSVDEGNFLTFTATAIDADLPANTLSFSLDAGAPAGAVINPSSGLFSWTPSEAQGPADYPVTVRVTDGGTPARDAFETFTIHVSEVNRAPELAFIGDQNLDEGSPLQFAAAATDPDLPANTLSYSLDAGAPAGAAIDPSTGVFSWTPSEAQGPGDYSVTLRVADNGTPALSASRMISIHVRDVNAAPELAAIADQSVNEGALLQLTATATDSDVPANTLSFSLDAGAPAGATINAATGVLSWVPSEAQGPADFNVTVRVTDNGTPVLSASRTFAIHVAEVNTAPALAAIGNQSVNEGSLLQFTASASDADQPANSLRFSMDAGAPAGAAIDPATGVFGWTPSEAQGPGDYSVTVRVTDDGAPALDASRTFAIHVGEVNLAPVLASIGGKSVTATRPLTFTASATDADLPANTLAFSLDAVAPTGATIDASTGVFSWTPTPAQGPGDYSVTVRVTDNGTPALDDFETIAIHVAAANTPPVLASIGNRTASEGSPFTFTATAADADVPANALAFSLDAGAPAGAAIDPSTGVFRWTPSEVQGPGDYSVTVRVTDDGTPQLDDYETISIHVSEVNQAPVLAAIGGKSVDEQHPLTFTATATDADLPANTLSFSLGANAPAGAAIDASTGAFSWTPTEAQGPADYNVTVRVTDNGTPALADSETIAIHVAEVNSAPALAAIDDKSVNEASLLTFTAAATDPDLPANALGFALDAGAPAGAAIDPATGVFSWTPTEAQGPGDYNVTVRVTDNGTPALDASRTFTVHVAEVNSVPALAAIGGKTVGEGSLLTFTATATDPDLPANVLSYTLDAGAPAGAAIDAATGVFSWTPTEAQGPGDYSVTVRVTDNGTPALSASTAFSIHVDEVNTAPQLAAIGSKTVSEGSLLTFTASATDADLPANALRYSLDSGAPTGAAMDSTTGVFTWTPTEAQGPADQSVTVRVTDNGTPALSAFETITIHVTEVNVAPVLAPIADKVLDEQTALSFTAAATDADLPANTLTWTLDSAPAGASIAPATGTFSWTPSEAQGPADYTIAMRVTDSGSPALSDVKSFHVHVNEVNRNPALAPISALTVNEQTLLAFTAAATDPDLPANTLAFSLDPGYPTGAAINAVTGGFTWTPTEAQGPGVYSITVRVTDNGSPALSDAKTFTVQVNEVNRPPVLSVPGSLTVNEGALVSLQPAGTDPDLPANTLTFSLVAPSPAGATINAATGTVTWRPPDNGRDTIRVALSDGQATVTGDVVITVLNVVPTVTLAGPAAGSAYTVNTPVTFTGTFADVPADTHTAAWTIGTKTVPGVVNEAAHTVTLSQSFTVPGIYSVSLRVTDDDGGVATVTQTAGGQDAMIVIYDPTSGLAKGSGWFDSPAAAAGSAASGAGRVSFDFSSTFDRSSGALPLGDTHVQATGLDFRSTSYDWLLILDSRAVYHGTGTLNGAGSYGFTMSMTDGRPDRLRIKIWNKSNAALVYDNQPGAPDSLAPSMAIGGGSILVMKAPGGPKSVAPASSAPVAQAGLPLEYALSQNRPNPFVERTQIAFALPEPSHVRLTVYDAQGRVLAELANGLLQAGRHERMWDGRARDGHVAEPGVYFLRLEARSQASERRLETTRKLTLTR